MMHTQRLVISQLDSIRSSSALLRMIIFASSPFPLSQSAFAVGRQEPSTDQAGEGQEKTGSSTSEVKKEDSSSLPNAAISSTAGVTFADPVTVRWKVGVRLVAGAADVYNVVIAIPVPNDWPEQSVSVDSEDLPPTVGNVGYGKLESGIRRQLIKIPIIKSGEEVEITTIFRVATSQIIAAPDPSQFSAPKSNHREGKNYLAPNQYISTQNSKLRNSVKVLVLEKENSWQQVEAIYDWVRDHIDQKEMPSTDAVRTFLKKEGSQDDKVALFVAMCRIHKIPARMVWVEGGAYAEFLLVDAQDQAHWFPCNIGGVREFGSMSEPQIILQKGEYIKVPEKAERQKFVAEHLSCQTTSQPVVQFVRELLPADN
jgi:hypothetical protein